jgi:hypothetical protein
MRYLPALLLAAAAVQLPGCGSDGLDEDEYSSDPCSPNYVPWAAEVIGPDGGTVTYDWPDDVLDQLHVTVPAGAWAQCWEVTLSYIWIWDTPDYPDGFVPFERPMPTGSIEISIFRQSPEGVITYAPDSMYLDVSFPLHDLPQDSLAFIAGFYYDSTAGDWGVELADDANDEFLTIRTHAWRRPWSFGRIDLADIDFQTYMVPALEDQVGTETWSLIQATMDSIYDAAMEDTWGPITCGVLNVAEGVFTEFRNYSADMVAAIQATLGCGDCDATTPEFWQGLRTYIQLNIQYMAVELFVDAMRGRAWPLKIVGYLVMGGLLGAMQALPCNYDCLMDEAPPWYYVYTAAYGTSVLIIEVIQAYRDGYTSCVPPPGAAAAASAPPSFCAAASP